MGKKSPMDIYKADMIRIGVRKRRALNGPFRCPKCLEIDVVSVQVKPITRKEIFTPLTGVSREVPVKYVRYIFSCSLCDFKTVVYNKNKDIIGTYNKMYDNQITPAGREEQIKMIQYVPYRTIKLLQTEVNMK